MKFNNIQLYSEKKDAKRMLESGADLILLDDNELSKYNQGQLEILDIYNENATRIGASSRKAYIKLGFITRAVHIFVFNEKGELYLQKRSANKDTYPGYYAPSVAGHVGLGETSELSAYRELEEEIGIRIPLTYFGTFKCFQPKNIVNQIYDFYIGFSKQSIQLDKNEAESGTFYPWKYVLNEMDKEKFVPALKQEINRFREDIQAELGKNHFT